MNSAHNNQSINGSRADSTEDLSVQAAAPGNPPQGVVRRLRFPRYPNRSGSLSTHSSDDDWESDEESNDDGGEEESHDFTTGGEKSAGLLGMVKTTLFGKPRIQTSFDGEDNGSSVFSDVREDINAALYSPLYNAALAVPTASISTDPSHQRRPSHYDFDLYSNQSSQMSHSSKQSRRPKRTQQQNEQHRRQRQQNLPPNGHIPDSPGTFRTRNSELTRDTTYQSRHTGQSSTSFETTEESLWDGDNLMSRSRTSDSFYPPPMHHRYSFGTRKTTNNSYMVDSNCSQDDESNVVTHSKKRSDNWDHEVRDSTTSFAYFQRERSRSSQYPRERSRSSHTASRSPVAQITSNDDSIAQAIITNRHAPPKPALPNNLQDSVSNSRDQQAAASPQALHTKRPPLPKQSKEEPWQEKSQELARMDSKSPTTQQDKKTLLPSIGKYSLKTAQQTPSSKDTEIVFSSETPHSQQSEITWNGPSLWDSYTQATGGIANVEQTIVNEDDEEDAEEVFAIADDSAAQPIILETSPAAFASSKSPALRRRFLAAMETVVEHNSSCASSAFEPSSSHINEIRLPTTEPTPKLNHPLSFLSNSQEESRNSEDEIVFETQQLLTPEENEIVFETTSKENVEISMHSGETNTEKLFHNPKLWEATSGDSVLVFSPTNFAKLEPTRSQAKTLSQAALKGSKGSKDSVSSATSSRKTKDVGLSASHSTVSTESGSRRSESPLIPRNPSERPESPAIRRRKERRSMSPSLRKNGQIRSRSPSLRSLVRARSMSPLPLIRNMPVSKTDQNEQKPIHSRSNKTRSLGEDELKITLSDPHSKRKPSNRSMVNTGSMPTPKESLEFSSDSQSVERDFEWNKKRNPQLFQTKEEASFADEQRENSNELVVETTDQPPKQSLLNSFLPTLCGAAPSDNSVTYEENLKERKERPALPLHFATYSHSADLSDMDENENSDKDISEKEETSNRKPSTPLKSAMKQTNANVFETQPDLAPRYENSDKIFDSERLGRSSVSPKRNIVTRIPLRSPVSSAGKVKQTFSNTVPSKQVDVVVETRSKNKAFIALEPFRSVEEEPIIHTLEPGLVVVDPICSTKMKAKKPSSHKEGSNENASKPTKRGFLGIGKRRTTLEDKTSVTNNVNPSQSDSSEAKGKTPQKTKAEGVLHEDVFTMQQKKSMSRSDLTTNSALKKRVEFASSIERPVDIKFEPKRSSSTNSSTGVTALKSILTKRGCSNYSEEQLSLSVQQLHSISSDESRSILQPVLNFKPWQTQSPNDTEEARNLTSSYDLRRERTVSDVKDAHSLSIAREKIDVQGYRKQKAIASDKEKGENSLHQATDSNKQESHQHKLEFSRRGIFGKRKVNSRPSPSSMAMRTRVLFDTDKCVADNEIEMACSPGNFEHKSSSKEDFDRPTTVVHEGKRGLGNIFKRFAKNDKPKPTKEDLQPDSSSTEDLKGFIGMEVTSIPVKSSNKAPRSKYTKSTPEKSKVSRSKGKKMTPEHLSRTGQLNSRPLHLTSSLSSESTVAKKSAHLNHKKGNGEMLDDDGLHHRVNRIVSSSKRLASDDLSIDEYSEVLSPRTKKLETAEELLSRRLAKDLELLAKIERMRKERNNAHGVRENITTFKGLNDTADVLRGVQALVLKQKNARRHDILNNQQLAQDSTSVATETATEATMTEQQTFDTGDDNSILEATDLVSPTWAGDMSSGLQEMLFTCGTPTHVGSRLGHDDEYF